MSAEAEDCDTCLWTDSSDSICFAMPQGNLRNNKKNYIWCTETKHELSMDGFTKQLTQEHK